MMDKIKSIVLVLSLLFVFGNVQAQQSFGVMSDSIVTNFIEEKIIADYGFMEVLVDYRDSTFKRTLLIYQKAGQRLQKVISGGCASKEQLEKMVKHLQRLEELIIDRDEKMKNLISDSKIKLLELTLEKYTARISKEKQLSLIINRDIIFHADKEVVDITPALIDLVQKEKKEINKMYEAIMATSKKEFENIVSTEKEVR